MGLMIVVGWISDSDAVRGSLVLWLLLVAAVGLSLWECRERGYRTTVTLWWIAFVAITHVLGYVVLRFCVPPPRRD